LNFILIFEFFDDFDDFEDFDVFEDSKNGQILSRNQ